MGVKGLWQLLEPTGRPVTLESLEGKVLAVDVSIWLNQAMKGMRDRDGNPLPNAHLLSLFNRVCKLLFYRIKPVFVFDGGVPQLKKQTLAARRTKKDQAVLTSEIAAKKMVTNLMKYHALKAVGGNAEIARPCNQATLPSSAIEKHADLFVLPPMMQHSVEENEDSETEWDDLHVHREQVLSEYQNLENIDTESADFLDLPQEVQHEILDDLREARKHHARYRPSELPEDSNEFSKYQVAKLMKQSQLSSKIYKCRKDMLEKISGDVAATLTGGHHVDSIETRRVASEDTSHYVLIKGLDKNKQQDLARDIHKKHSVNSKMHTEDSKKTPEQNDSKMEKLKVSSSITPGGKDTMLTREDNDDVSATDVVRTKPGASGQSKASMASDMQIEMSKFIARHKRKIEPVTLSDNSSDDEKEAKRTPKDIHGRYKKSSKKSEVTKPVDDDVIYVDETAPKSPPVIDLSSDKFSTEGGFIRDEEVIVIDEVKPVMDSDSLQKQINDFLKKNALKKRKERHSRSVDHANDVDNLSQSSKSSVQNSHEDCEGLRLAAMDKANGGTISDEEESEDSKMQIALRKLRQKRSSLLTVNDVKMLQARKNKTGVKLESSVESTEDVKPVKIKEEKDDMDKFAKVLNNKEYELNANHKNDNDLKIKVEKSEKNQSSGLDSSLTADYLESEPGPTHNDKYVRVKMEKPDVPPMGLTAGFLESNPSHPTQRSKAAAESESDDEGFIEITIDPEKAQPDDDLFPASIFTQSAPRPQMTSVASQNSAISEITTSHQTSLKSKKSFEIMKQTELDSEESTNNMTAIANDVLNSEDNSSDVSMRTAPVAMDTSQADIVKKTVVSMDTASVSDEELFAAAADVDEPLPVTEAPSMASDEELFAAAADVDEPLPVTEAPSMASDEELFAAAADVDEPLPVTEAPSVARGRVSPQKIMEEDRTYDEISQRVLTDLGADLAQENYELLQEMGRQQRLATSVTEQMAVEAQDLLRLFGVPFIVSPMEAEAQCAHLDLTNQTQGTVTDDGDVWLFGGRCVYKNFFNQGKHVEFYKAHDINSQMMLDREGMICVALLCGSDYTTGVEGIGPVSAMELMGEFGGTDLDTLRNFKSWWDTAKDSTKGAENRIRGRLQKIELPDGFPNDHIVEAYTKPAVDQSEEAFSWSRPDLGLLREYARERFGWNREKIDEIILPVLKRLNEKQFQSTISSYFLANQIGDANGLKSARLKNILNRMRNPELPAFVAQPEGPPRMRLQPSDEDEEEAIQGPAKKKRKRVTPLRATTPGMNRGRSRRKKLDPRMKGYLLADARMKAQDITELRKTAPIKPQRAPIRPQRAPIRPQHAPIIPPHEVKLSESSSSDSEDEGPSRGSRSLGRAKGRGGKGK